MINTTFVSFIPNLFLFSVCLIFIGAGLYLGSLAQGQIDDSYEKISSYECGFNAFANARESFDIKFYLIAILFIIFDIEVLFLFPWIFSMRELGYYGYFILAIFLIILILGFGYEWVKGCMDFS